MTAIILAGGKSSRFGSDKAFIEIDGRPLLERQLKLLKKIFKKIIIVTNKPKKFRFKSVRLVKDLVRNRGPLAGIYSGLMASHTFYNFVVACDMPFLNQKLIRHMIRLKDGFDVVIPYAKKRFETLFAIYSKNCIEPIYEVLYTDNLRVRNFFDKVRVKVVGRTDIARFGDPKTLFMNINTASEFERIYKKGHPIMRKSRMSDYND